VSSRRSYFDQPTKNLYQQHGELFQLYIAEILIPLKLDSNLRFLFDVHCLFTFIKKESCLLSPPKWLPLSRLSPSFSFLCLFLLVSYSLRTLCKFFPCEFT